MPMPAYRRDGREQEPVADPLPRHAHLLGDREREQEGDEAAGVEAVVLLELAVECRCCSTMAALIRLLPRRTPYSLSSLFM